MKRNYFTPVLGLIAGIGLLTSGMLASASTPWKSVLDGEDAHPSKSVRVANPMSRALNVRKAGNPENSVIPLGKNIQSYPAQRARKAAPASIMRSPESPRGHFYGIVNRYSDMELRSEAYFGELDLASGKLTPLFYGPQYSPYAGDDYVFQADSYRKGEIVCVSFYQQELSNGGTRFCSQWDLYDINTGEFTGTHDFEDSMAAGYSVSYDADDDIFYVCAIDMSGAGGGDSMLGVVKPNDNGEWTYTHHGKLETQDGYQPFIAAIAYNPVDKQLYAFSNSNIVYTVEVADSKGRPDSILVEAGEIDMEDGSFLFECDSNDPMAGQICYSPMDESFVAIYRDNAKRIVRLAYIHPETFEGIIGEDVSCPNPSFYITAIFCTDDFASSEAPTLSPKPTFSFDKANLSGTINLSAPTESYIGIDLTGTDLQAVTKIDGNVVDSRTVKAGESFALPITLEQGQHKLEFTTAIGDEVSPVNTVLFYVGYDAPMPVKNIKLDNNILSWDAPTGIGYHNGYVDLNDITYNIYLGGIKQNAAPVTETTYTLSKDVDMQRYEVGVEAVSHGVSAPAATISQIYGKAFSLPFLQTPTVGESINYTIVNANGDVRRFFHGDNVISPTERYEGMSFVCGYMDDADDWLFLPLMNFPDASKLYTFDFDIRGVYPGRYTSESVGVFLADAPNPDGTILEIYSTSDQRVIPEIPDHKSFSFAVPKAGDYYLAIHVTSTRDQNSYGMTFHNFDVKAVEGITAAVPAAPTDVVVKAADFGEQAVDVTAVLPTVDILGNPLPENELVTLTLEFTDNEGITNAQSASGYPGTPIEVSNGSNGDGYVVYYLTPSNSVGKGYTKSYRLYVGMDKPLHPENIRGVPTEDNLGMNMEWDCPGPVGINGGYVDLEGSDFQYKFYTMEGISLHLIQGGLKDTHYTFYPFGEGGTGPLQTFNMGPTACNSAGESVGSLFVREDIGAPYELPILEEWNSAKFSYSPYTYFTSGAYELSGWSSTSNALGLGIGNAGLVQGGLFGFSEGPSKSKLILPKFSTKGIKKTLFKLRYWDYAGAPSKIYVIGRRAGHDEEEIIGEFELNRPARGKWVDGEIALPDSYSNVSWAQIRLETFFKGVIDEFLLLDNFQLLDDADFDLKLTGLSGITEASVGDELAYNVTLANSGRERMNGTLKVEVISPDNEVLASDITEIPMLTSNQIFEHTANFQVSFNYPSVIIRATIDTEDENSVNNVKELVLNIKPATIPMVTDLAAVVNEDDNVELSWSTPSTEYGNFENFEGYAPFDISDTFDYWRNINGDDLWPMSYQNQTTGEIATWPSAQDKKGWQIVDFDLMNVPNERLRPHSGKQFLFAQCGGYDQDETPVQTSKWLVSPVLVPQTSFTFWYTTFESSTTEYVEIWTCEKENGVLDVNDANIRLGRAGDFHKRASKSKAGSETWEFIKYDLSRREVKVALRYASYDGYGVGIDDISMTPANMLNRTAESYNVYRCNKDGSNPVLIAENITDTHFTDTNWDKTEALYYVVSNCTVNDKLVSGPHSNNVYVTTSAVGEISDFRNVTAGKGYIRVNGFQGEKLVVSAADGKVVLNTVVNGSNVSYTLDKGVYVATIGKNNYKVVVR